MTAATATTTSDSQVGHVDVAAVIHPLVPLSVADQYRGERSRKRVVGVLLGSIYMGNVDATNKPAVPLKRTAESPRLQSE
jgi:hypothetical protein